MHNNKVVTFGVYVVALIAMLVGLLFSPLPARAGLYRWLATKNPALIGLGPAFTTSDEWGFTFEQLSKVDLTGQTALVTGANSGVGYETALALAKQGAASVTMACRNLTRCEAAAEEIRLAAQGKSVVSTMILDTSSLRSVKRFAEEYLEQQQANQTLDMLFLNAGIARAGVNKDGSTRLSEDGIEMVFATNHVGHHLLYKLLEPLVLKSKLARIVLTSSAGSFHSLDYKVATDVKTLNSVDERKQGQQVYGQSKLAQILFAKELTRRLGPQSNVYVNAVHPGAVNTNIWDKIPGGIPTVVMKALNYLREKAMWTSAEGALTMLYLGVATDELVEKNLRGKYFHPQSVEVVNPLALDEDLQKRVWNFSDELVKEFLQ